MNIKKIDKNFLSDNNLKSEGVKVYSVLDEPFEICGIIPPKNENEEFHRLPYDFAKSVNKNIENLNINTSGGKIKFRTDSDYIGIYAELNSVADFNHMSAVGFMGFDLYAKEDGEKGYFHIHTFIPQKGEKVISKGISFDDYHDRCPDELFDKSLYVWPVEIGKNKKRDIILNMPLYSGVSKLYIILSEDAALEKAAPFLNKLPVVVYGNSLTQGACASRPGLSWTNIIALRNNLDIINLGFSGNCKGQPEMAEYFANIEASVFISDYDWNSADDVDLRSNLKRMLEIIREKKPDLPIICLSRPCFMEKQTSVRRRKAIEDIVLERKKSGDNNIYFIDGREVGEMFGAYDAITVEGWHLSDIGMFCEAAVVEKVLLEIIKKGNKT